MRGTRARGVGHAARFRRARGIRARRDFCGLRSLSLAGAAGYVLKDIRGQGLLESIRRVANGEILVDPAVTKRVVARATTGADAAADLSLRERQVLDQIAAGLTNRQIAEHLGLAEKTVKNYVSGLLAKLGMERRTQAAVYRANQTP